MLSSATLHLNPDDSNIRLASLALSPVTSGTGTRVVFPLFERLNNNLLGLALSCVPPAGDCFAIVSPEPITSKSIPSSIRVSIVDLRLDFV